MAPDELAKLQADAEKYRWLLEHFPVQIGTLAWVIPDACKDECNRPDVSDQQRTDDALSVAVKQVPRKR